MGLSPTLSPTLQPTLKKRPFNGGSVFNSIPDNILLSAIRFDLPNKLTVDGSNNVASVRDLANGWDWVQETGANQPLWDGTNKVSFNGTSEFLKLDRTSAQIASWLDGVNSGSIFWCGQRANNTKREFPFSIAKTIANDEHIHIINQTTGAGTIPDEVGIQFENGATVMNKGTDSSYSSKSLRVFNVDGGNETTVWINGSQVACGVEAGTDDGKFFNDLDIINSYFSQSIEARLGAASQLTTFYGEFDMFYFGITNRILTSAEIAALNTELS